MRHADAVWIGLAFLLAYSCGLDSHKPDSHKADASRETSGSACTCMTEGCCAGQQCLSGKESNACGKNGGLCVQCEPSTSCQEGRCVPVGGCARDNQTCQADGKDGLCHSGACCTGCWSATFCDLGTTDSRCGSQGEDCSVCSGGASCKEGRCCLPDGATPATLESCCSRGVCSCVCLSSVCKLTGSDCIATCEQACSGS